MKKLLILAIFLFILPISACRVKESASFECIHDELQPKSSPTFCLSADIPQGTFLTTSCKEGCCALFSHEDYEVMQEIFYADNLDAALSYLTGKSQQELHPLVINTFPQTEYQFAWSAAGENGTLACKGQLFSDGEYYYSLCIFCPAEEEKEYREVFSQIFSGTELMPV